jgi:hypothetical protein
MFGWPTDVSQDVIRGKVVHAADLAVPKLSGTARTPIDKMNSYARKAEVGPSLLLKMW